MTIVQGSTECRIVEFQARDKFATREKLLLFILLYLMKYIELLQLLYMHMILKTYGT